MKQSEIDEVELLLNSTDPKDHLKLEAFRKENGERGDAVRKFFDRIDKRTIGTFLAQMRVRHENQRRHKEIVFKCLSVEDNVEVIDNGTDNSGRIVLFAKPDADYIVRFIDEGIEILLDFENNEHTPMKATFKEDKVNSCIKQKAFIFMVFVEFGIWGIISPSGLKLITKNIKCCSYVEIGGKDGYQLTPEKPAYIEGKSDPEPFSYEPYFKTYKKEDLMRVADILKKVYIKWQAENSKK